MHWLLTNRDNPRPGTRPHVAATNEGIAGTITVRTERAQLLLQGSGQEKLA